MASSITHCVVFSRSSSVAFDKGRIKYFAPKVFSELTLSSNDLCDMFWAWNRHALCHVLWLFRSIVEVATGDWREAEHRCKRIEGAARNETFTRGMLLLLMLLDVQESRCKICTVCQSITVRWVCQIKHGELECQFFQCSLIAHLMRMIAVTRSHRWRWRRWQETVT